MKADICNLSLSSIFPDQTRPGKTRPSQTQPSEPSELAEFIMRLCDDQTNENEKHGPSCLLLGCSLGVVVVVAYMVY